jgi:molecular chaperone DnaK (HSP70)
LGGGTFDVTIIDYFAGMLTTLAVFGNNNLGGDDFDRRLMRYLSNCVKNEQGISIDLGTDDEPTPAAVVLKQEAEKAKIRLSRQNEMPVRIGKITESNGKPIGIDTVIKTEQFNGLIKDLVDGTLAEVQKALDYAKLKKGDIDTVLLVGGSTYMPLVQQTVRNFFGKEPNKSVNPDLAVAFGAAASLVHEPPENRHVVTVGFIPETTPSQELEISGRTSPASKVKITGGQETVTATANETGHYDAVVPLQLGINTLQVEAISPDGKRKSLEPEPVVYDVNAEQVEEPCAPPAPHLARALSVSCALPLGGNRIITDNAAIILKPQMELPASFSADHFATVVDNQSELVGQVLEGDIPIAGMNTWLAEMRLVLPPNVPGQERVVVNFSVDENYMITAELEVPSINKKKTVRVNIKSTAQQVHIFDQINELLNVSGDRIRPEERARLEQARLTIEDLSAEFRRQSDAGDADGMWNTYNRLTAEGDRLRTALSELGAKYR